MHSGGGVDLRASHRAGRLPRPMPDCVEPRWNSSRFASRMTSSLRSIRAAQSYTRVPVSVPSGASNSWSRRAAGMAKSYPLSIRDRRRQRPFNSSVIFCATSSFVAMWSSGVAGLPPGSPGAGEDGEAAGRRCLGGRRVRMMTQPITRRTRRKMSWHLPDRRWYLQARGPPRSPPSVPLYDPRVNRWRSGDSSPRCLRELLHGTLHFGVHLFDVPVDPVK